MNSRFLTFLLGSCAVLAGLLVPLLMNYGVESVAVTQDVSEARGDRKATRPNQKIIERRQKTPEVKSLAQIRREAGIVGSRVRSIYKKPYKSPSLSNYRAEVARDPHGVAPSLEAFAMEMAAEMRRARASVEGGRKVFSKLIQCAGSNADEEILAVRAACAKNAKTLAHLYPDELEAGFESLMKTLDHKVKTLL